MTGNEYQRLAARTMPKPENRKASLMHGLLGLASEAGEVLGLYQKVYQGHKLDLDHVEKELGDVTWMICEICTASGIEFDEVLATNIQKLAARYPKGFEVKRSLHRKDGDI